MQNIPALLKKQYNSPEEVLILGDRLDFSLAVWLDIIIKHSNEKVKELKDNQKQAIQDFGKQFNILIRDEHTIGDVDYNVVKNILSLAIKLKKKSIIDLVYKRIKYAIPKYFYGFDLINAYVALLEIDKAKEILDYMINKDIKSYWYQIIYATNIYDNYPEMHKFFREKQCECYAKLLKSGETLELNISLDLLSKINQYI